MAFNGKHCHHCVWILIFILMVFQTKTAFSQQTDLVPYISADREVICKGQVATLTIRTAYKPNESGTYDIWTEDVRTEESGGLGYDCTVLKEIIPDITGDGIISKQYIRRGCGFDQSIISTIIVRVMPTENTTYTFSWAAEWRASADPVLGTPETLLERRTFNGSITIKVVKDDPPVITPGKVILNQSENPAQLTATAPFLSDNRKISWYLTECSDNIPILIGTALVYPPEMSTWIYANTDKLGTVKYQAEKIDNGCISRLSDPVEVTIKPCGKTPGGCNQDEVAFIESQSCSDAAEARGDHHFYTHEKTLCTNCDLESVWTKYKSNINNQAIVLSDAIPGFEWAAGKLNIAFLSSIFPDNNNASQPITDCIAVDLPRFSTFAIHAGLVAGAEFPGVGIVSDGLALVQDACAINPNSYTDPIFMRVDESSKCVINYTRPGHILYPGKVTRCLVKECNEVKIKTFGEGTTLFPNNACGKILKYANEFFGDQMFKNVDERFYNSLQSDGPVNVNKGSGGRVLGDITLPGQDFLVNNWKIKTLKLKYEGNDSLFSFYSFDDNRNFLNLRNIKINLKDNGQYTGTDTRGSLTTGVWMYDSAEGKLVTDSVTVKIVSANDNEFTVMGKIPVFKDTVLSAADYFMTFYKDVTALPVVFGKLLVTPQDCDIKLNFQVLSQYNNKQFEIERSANGATGWSTIAVITGEQQSSKEKNYQYVDRHAAPGENYYRIKQTDLDGHMSYSVIVNIKNDRCKLTRTIAYPNPFSNSIVVNVAPGVTNSTIRLLNVAGQELQTIRNPGSTYTISTAGFLPGLYILEVQNDSRTVYRIKLIKGSL